MTRICLQCPRACGIDRTETTGFCGMPREFRIARAALHPWEEPCLCGENGSGTLFFCGCNLRCIFCQNRQISRGELPGRVVPPKQLIALMLRLRDEGAANINLVTPTHYAQELIPVLREVRPRLEIPIVYNCGGYESVQTLRQLEGLIDIYLPDCKYFSPELSRRYSAAPDYYTIAENALREMLRQTGIPAFSPDGRMQRGVMVRHLVLPGCRKDSIALLDALYAAFGTSAFRLSLMSQYTPDFAPPDAEPNLHRRLTAFEYESVLSHAQELGFDGYFQSRASARSSYTPDFLAETLGQ